MSEDDGTEFDPLLALEPEDLEREARQEVTDAVDEHLRRSKQAYTSLFVAGDATEGDVDFVMRDLCWFAQTDIHFSKDPRVQDMYAGRKQVVQRIAEYTNLSIDVLTKRYLETQN